jgi:hypothetical protein
MPFLLSLKFSLQQNQRTKEQNRLCPEAVEGVESREVAQTMYTHVRKCKSNKFFLKRKMCTETFLIGEICLGTSTAKLGKN